MAFLIKIITLVLLTFGSAQAEVVTFPASLADMPEYTLLSAPETALPIRIKPGKPETVHLTEEVGRVVVNDKPENISAIIYDERSIVLFPHKAAGGAHFTVFGKDGKTLMSRYALVGAPDKKYVRMHKICKAGSEFSCQKTTVYYCPNFCYETQLVGAAAVQTVAK
jgi:Flp pilus assembly secretin CpaC